MTVWCGGVGGAGVGQEVGGGGLAPSRGHLGSPWTGAS